MLKINDLAPDFSAKTYPLLPDGWKTLKPYLRLVKQPD